MVAWQCATGCGACCYLEPSERPHLEDYLSPEELERYLSLVGPDGWCVRYDRASRQCTIYPDRPRFCRVDATVFREMFGILPEELDEFAIDCCREHINDIYGDRSPEKLRFEGAIASDESEMLPT